MLSGELCGLEASRSAEAANWNWNRWNVRLLEHPSDDRDELAVLFLQVAVTRLVQDVIIAMSMPNLIAARDRMAGLWRIITAALFVAHLMMGCCAHHSHGCEGTGHSFSDDDATHGDRCDSRDGHSQNGSHAPHGCHGNPCSFVLPCQLANPSDSQLCQTFVALLVDYGASQLGIASRQRSTPPGRFSPLVRLHLANQVLLI